MEAIFGISERLHGGGNPPSGCQKPSERCLPALQSGKSLSAALPGPVDESGLFGGGEAFGEDLVDVEQVALH